MSAVIDFNSFFNNINTTIDQAFDNAEMLFEDAIDNANQSLSDTFDGFNFGGFNFNNSQIIDSFDIGSFSGDSSIGFSTETNQLFGGEASSSVSGEELEGTSGDDVMQGTDGDDCIIAGPGSDFLIGGDGADVFKFNAEDFANGDVDVISDFQLGEDSIIIEGVGDGSVAFDANAEAISLNGHNVIEFGADSSELGGLEVSQDENGDFEIM